jgi:hypothetical protein
MTWSYLISKEVGINAPWVFHCPQKAESLEIMISNSLFSNFLFDV